MLHTFICNGTILGSKEGAISPLDGRKGWRAQQPPAKDKQSERKEKVLENDGWAQIESWTDAFTVDAQCPRVEVELEEV